MIELMTRATTTKSVWRLDADAPHVVSDVAQLFQPRYLTVEWIVTRDHAAVLVRLGAGMVSTPVLNLRYAATDHGITPESDRLTAITPYAGMVIDAVRESPLLTAVPTVDTLIQAITTTRKATA